MWMGAYATVSSNTTVYFIYNTAKVVGGAIYSESDTNSLDVCTFNNFTPIFENNKGLTNNSHNVYNGLYW